MLLMSRVTHVHTCRVRLCSKPTARLSLADDRATPFRNQRAIRRSWQKRRAVHRHDGMPEPQRCAVDNKSGLARKGRCTASAAASRSVSFPVRNHLGSRAAVWFLTSSGRASRIGPSVKRLSPAALQHLWRLTARPSVQHTPGHDDAMMPLPPAGDVTTNQLARVEAQRICPNLVVGMSPPGAPLPTCAQCRQLFEVYRGRSGQTAAVAVLDPYRLFGSGPGCDARNVQPRGKAALRPSRL
jgi:hypothetical protein